MHTCLVFLERFLRFVSDKQVPFWLEHPESIATGIYGRHLSTWVTQLQIVLSQHHVNEPEEETRDPSGNKFDLLSLVSEEKFKRFSNCEPLTV